MQGIYDSFHNFNPPIPTCFLREMLGLILNENSLQVNGENYLKTHGTAMGTKVAVSFANIFMAKIEATLIQQSETNFTLALNSRPKYQRTRLLSSI